MMTPRVAAGFIGCIVSAFVAVIAFHSLDGFWSMFAAATVIYALGERR